eukprot:11750332-Heterocapsa_arctica.AAC.1
MLYKEFEPSGRQYNTDSLQDVYDLTMINTLPGLEAFLSQLDALLLRCVGEQPSLDMMTCRFHRQIEKLPVLNRDMEDYSRMRDDDPNRSYEWLRLRCN